MSSLIEILSKTGGPPDVRRMNRDLLITYFGHDFGIGVSSFHHGRIYSKILENYSEYLVSNMIFSNLNSYMKGESDIFQLVGTILIGLEKIGVDINTKNILNKIDNVFENDLVAKSSVHFQDTNVEPEQTNKKQFSVLQYCLFIVFSVFVTTLVVGGVGKIEQRSQVKNTNIQPRLRMTNLPVATDIMTPLWTLDKSMFPSSSNHVDKVMYGWIDDIRKEFAAGTTQFYGNDKFTLNVNATSIKPELHASAKVWIEYMIDTIDPAYIWSQNDKPIINLSNKNKNFGDDGLALGFFHPRSNDILIKERDDEELDDEMTVIKTLIHEMSHKVHLDTPDVFIPCSDEIEQNKDRLCRNPLRIDRNRTEKAKNHISSKYDEARGVLYLGLQSENMSPDEAKIYLKLNLDLRIEKIYNRAMKSGKYPQDDRATFYSLSDHFEFWAEASTSFILEHYEHFQSREWIQENDPELFTLLQEVYSGKYVF